jgi:hypothetical protein
VRVIQAHSGPRMLTVSAALPMTTFRWLFAAAAACALFIVIFAFRAGGPERAQPQPPSPAQRVESANPLMPAKPAAAGSAPVATPVVGGGAAPTPAQAVSQILEAIHQASISYDAKELPKIQPHLIHPDAEVRAAALEGVLVLGDAAGAPLLRRAASTLKDPREAVKYLEAADYLELPSGSLLAGKKKAGSPAKDEARKDGQAPARIPFRPNRD